MTYATSGGAVSAIDGVTFDAARGEFVSIVGPSGCGKSTLLKLVADLLVPTSGSITISGLPNREARLRGMFSLVFQNPVLLPWRRLIDNVRLPLEILDRRGRQPGDALELVGLTGYEHLYPHELSGGMQQRAAIARALTFDPEILLMDEPFAAVDELTRNSLNTRLMAICERVLVTVLFVTHSLVEAAYLSDRIIVLTRRPARIRSIVVPPFARPRVPAVVETKEFQEVLFCLRQALALN